MDRRNFFSLGSASIAYALSPAAKTTAAPTYEPCAPLAELPAPPPPEANERMFPGFAVSTVKTTGAVINVLKGGKGPPLLLIHGHPETHVTWHKIAADLARNYTVIIPDLRGYGDSSKPDGGENHINYSFRAMAQDQVETMQHFGYQRFLVAGHDRGARVVHRLCLDHPNSVLKACIMDIAPTLTMYSDTNKEFATRYVWWFFQIQPFPMPEHFIGNDPEYYLKEHLAVQNKTPGAITPEAMAEYLRCYCCRGTIHAVCEDYRAAAGIDLEMDAADDKAGHKITAPLLALWGAKGVVGEFWPVLQTWRPKATSVSGKALDCGHLLPEEQPQAVLTKLQAFFRS